MMLDQRLTFFNDLIEAHAMLPDYQRAYVRLNQVFYRSVQQGIASACVNFSGTFAKVDYLLKEHNAPKHLQMSVNDARVRLRNRAQLLPEDLEAHFFDDLKAVALFVAIVFDADPPASLTRLFRPESVKRQKPARRLNVEYFRAIVDSIDERYIYCHADDADALASLPDIDPLNLKVGYAAANRSFPGDWTYLQAMLTEGMQINVVSPRVDGSVISADLIIVEPDQLINVSTVAACFTNYAQSYVVELIKRISPTQMSEAILLGNLASQLLDEAIHQSDRAYSETVTTFFKDYALNMITTKISEKFHSDAKEQKANIDAAINTALPWTLSRFDSKEGIVEPSFFSEMLGLQGRMDFLQLDFKVLLEQKSGKSANYRSFDRPVHKTDHYVQLLLYMLVIRYNFRREYRANNSELHAFLLYSKYKEGLINMPFSPDLLFQAIKVRNSLAWANIQYTTPKGIRLLQRLTLDKINKLRTTDNLWTQYQSVDISRLLAPIHQASDLERDYYFRFLNFLAAEHLMAKTGTPDRDCSGFASTWQESADDKRMAGNIFDALTLVMPSTDEEQRVRKVQLRFAETDDHDMSNFRKGDIVILYPYALGDEPDARRVMVHRCTITDISEGTISLQLRAPQSDSRVFAHASGMLWAIEHDFMESSFASLYRGMHAFLSAPKSRRDLLLVQRHPIVNKSLTLKGEYGKFNDMMLRVKQARDLFIIIGPPGTGKTSFGMLNTLKEELLEPGSSVALISYTNRAVDEICSKLHAAGIDFIRIGSAATCDDAYKPYLLSERLGTISKLAEIKELVANSRVFVGTSTAFNSYNQIFSLRRFSLAVIDEASQILEPHLIGLLSASSDGHPAISKIVLIGDHKQLPAVVQQPKYVSQVTEPTLRAIGLTDCRNSLFERILSVYGSDPAVTFMLTQQGRMHPAVADFANYAFYGGMLRDAGLEHQISDIPPVSCALTSRVAFRAVDPPSESSSDKVNLAEANAIAEFVVDVYCRNADTFSSDTVGVIVPYRNQIAAVRSCLETYGIPALREVTIDTVERYQGSQRDIIVYGFTVQRPYQLDFLTDNRFVDSQGALIDRKLNVAMTRAKHYLLMVGNPRLLADDPIFSQIIENYQIFISDNDRGSSGAEQNISKL